MKSPLIYRYWNLSQCIGDRQVYLRSTDVEQKNYHRLLWAVPDEWLSILMNGNAIMVYDKSSNRRGKIERIFIPVLNDLLNYIYFGREIENKCLKHHFQFAIDALNKDKHLLKKYTFWKRYMRNPINISGLTLCVSKERTMLEL
jgi:hypothetical protein